MNDSADNTGANGRRLQELKRLASKLGLATADLEAIDWPLFDRALIHPSASADNNYEHLEFVGDAVLRLVAAEVLLETYPQAPVGEHAALRSIVTSDRVLAQLGANLGLDRYLVVSAAAATNAAGEQSRLADAFEAILGALYLSTGTAILVRPWLDSLLQAQAEIVRRDPARLNYKDALQEWTQAEHKCLPTYHIAEAAESFYNDPERFTAEVWLGDRCLGTGKGRSKKLAEQTAAREAYLGLPPATKK